MKKNQTRDYEYYRSDYECCVKSGSYGLNSTAYAEENTLKVWEVIKRCFAILCGIIGVAFFLLALAGMLLTGDAIHVSNWGGEVQILSYPISLNTAFGLGFACFFLGSLLGTLFVYITDKVW